MRLKELTRTCLFLVGRLLYGNKNSKIVYYHDIYNENQYTDMGTPLPLFKKHLEVLSKCGYKIVPNIKDKTGEIAIMLDDGFRGIWDCREYFYEKGLRPTIFIAKTLVGKEGYLSEDEIKELATHGWFFQSHTVSHNGMNGLSFDQLDYELKESKHYLEILLGKQIDEICAPIGEFSNWVCEYAYRAGYNVLYSSTPGDYFERLTDFSFVIPRNLCQALTPFQFKMAINGGYKIFQRVYFKRRYKHINTAKK